MSAGPAWTLNGRTFGATTGAARAGTQFVVSTVPDIPQTFSISVIAFTDRKLRSHWPSVTPSARVLVRFPLHVILSVEAAFPSTIVPKTSEKM
jgi:hypothetical protein